MKTEEEKLWNYLKKALKPLDDNNKTANRVFNHLVTFNNKREEKNLISFGQYLFSKERDKTIRRMHTKREVYGSDIPNWRDSESRKSQKSTPQNGIISKI